MENKNKCLGITKDEDYKYCSESKDESFEEIGEFMVAVDKIRRRNWTDLFIRTDKETQEIKESNNQYRQEGVWKIE